MSESSRAANGCHLNKRSGAFAGYTVRTCEYPSAATGCYTNVDVAARSVFTTRRITFAGIGKPEHLKHFGSTIYSLPKSRSGSIRRKHCHEPRLKIAQ